ncbi:MAG: beta-ketoacyl-ACP synthase II [Candidatus Omnitrophica bacterium]|nr:beta-ketoacyl-ACP synthase II [Candidatus Omnitrophota bacterium]
MSKRVVITGVGVIACNGIGKQGFWESLKSGRTGIARIQSFDPSPFPTQMAGEVRDFDPEQYMDKKKIKRMDRTSQFAVAAAKMAVQDADIELCNGYKESAGVLIGTAMAGQAYITEQHDAFRDKGPMKINPNTALASFPDACCSQISIELGIQGPSFQVATACSSALDAIGVAYQGIKRGWMDAAVVGGAEATLFPEAIAAFSITRAMSRRNDEPKKACRPFTIDRDGFVLGEGAGILILEDYKKAQKRGARIYAEILSHGMTTDAYHMTAPEPSGEQAARAMRIALEGAGIRPEEIDYINAHGTSTPLNDVNETRIIKEVFGAHAKKIPISATKSMVGHLIGAAGSVELIAMLLAMEHNEMPPTINYDNPDPECDLDYVPNTSRKKQIRTAMKNSFGFGGKNSILIVRKV